jgi:NDP-sugar pyrophosphorylase family protein
MQMQKLKALVLAGGKGTRLRPYTTVLPKPLMPVGDYPILEIILRQLKAAGVTDVILAVSYMSQIFQAFFQQGQRLGLRISYSFEDRELGTAGPIALAIDKLGKDFIVMNGDLLTTLDYRKLFTEHLRTGACATIATYRREIKVDFGIVESDKNGNLTNYIEKPVYEFDVSMGVNVFNAKRVRPYLVRSQKLDIPTLVTRLREAGETVRCHREPCFWLDIGRVDDYKSAHDVFETRKGEFLGGSP